MIRDFEYTYRTAITEGVCRYVCFPPVGGSVQWTYDGDVESGTLDDDNADEVLRYMLDADGNWMRDVLTAADRQLTRVREEMPNAGGMVLATDQPHAQDVARVLKDVTGEEPEIVISDDGADARRRIDTFRQSTKKWIVAVRMISEGTDIPRLRVGVYATVIKTELFFRQAVGRIVRQVSLTIDELAYLFIPDHPALRAHALRIRDEAEAALRAHFDEREQTETLEEQRTGAMPRQFRFGFTIGSEAEFRDRILDGVELARRYIELAQHYISAGMGGGFAHAEGLAAILQHAFENHTPSGGASQGEQSAPRPRADERKGRSGR